LYLRGEGSFEKIGFVPLRIGREESVRKRSEVLLHERLVGALRRLRGIGRSTAIGESFFQTCTILTAPESRIAKILLPVAKPFLVLVFLFDDIVKLAFFQHPDFPQDGLEGVLQLILGFFIEFDDLVPLPIQSRCKLLLACPLRPLSGQ
jgi:hypothetical protein